MTLGEIIRRYREEEHLSMDEFSKKAGISKQYISILERNYNPSSKKPPLPTMETIMAVSAAMGKEFSEIFSQLDRDQRIRRLGEKGEQPALPKGAEQIDFSKYHKIPILGRISAGLPIYAEENIEGYTLTDLNHGGEYFALRVQGDSMNAVRINDGDIVIVRRQQEVENGEITVVLVDNENATIKRFYATKSTVTLMPQSTNPIHQPQIYDLAATNIQVLGRVVKVEFSL